MQKEITIYVKEHNSFINIILPCPLSERETVVFRQLLHGKTVTEIARDQHRSVKTISMQKTNVYKKLGISNDITLWRDIFLLNNDVLSAKKHTLTLIRKQGRAMANVSRHNNTQPSVLFNVDGK